MRLYSYWRSTSSYRVCAALNTKGLPYETIATDLAGGDQHKSEYAALNPNKGAPTLVLDDGTILTQPLAILEYLDAIAIPKLLPDNPLERAKVLAAAHAIALDIHPVNNLRIIQRLKAEYDADGRKWMLHWMMAGFESVEPILFTSTPFAFSNTPDLADLRVVSQVYNARRWGLDMSQYPNIRRVENACLGVPAIDAARPENQPDAKE